MNLTPAKDDLWMLPLGGCGLFGANMTLYGHDGWWIAVDCGTAFADDRQPGIDMMLPDIRFIEERKNRLAAIVITHAHEDHIGGLPYIWPRLDVPVFATPFAAEIIKRKCSEFDDARNIVIKPLPTGTPLKIQGFSVTALPLSHSIPEPRALHIKTEAGALLHTGDWNMDKTPVLGHTTKQEVFSSLGPLCAMVGDSTNAMVPGGSATEAAMQPAFEQIFAKAEKRVAVTMFSSNVGRLIAIAKAADKVGRKVAVVGRSLRTMIEAGATCGYLEECPPLMSDKEAAEMKAAKIVYLVAGSQGEPRSALARIARDDHPFIELGKGDLVCFSARAIPGNEKKINEVINNLIGRGVRVVTADDAPIHVSGHAYAGDIQTMLEWSKPQSLVAVHGETMQQEAQVALARAKNIEAIAPGNGQLWALQSGTPKLIDKVETGFQYIEERRILDPDHAAVHERRKISFNGAVFVTVNKGEVIVSTLGLIDERDEDDRDILEDLRGQLRQLIRDGKPHGHHSLNETLRTYTRRYFDTELGFKPLTIVHIP